jgi:heme O synthase-like polyprenyltransferase
VLAVVRVLGLLVAVALGAAVLAWALTGERRWLRIAWLIFKYALFAFAAILVLFAAEAVLSS